MISSDALPLTSGHTHECSLARLPPTDGNDRVQAFLVLVQGQDRPDPVGGRSLARRQSLAEMGIAKLTVTVQTCSLEPTWLL